MKLAPLVVFALVACKSHKPVAPAAGSAVVATPVAKSVPTPAPAAAPAAPSYVAPSAPDDEVVPQQAAAAGSAVVPVVNRDPVARQFDKLDANHDGKLTPDEVNQHFSQDVDTNGDGEISKSELEAAMREKRIRARGGHVH